MTIVADEFADAWRSDVYRVTGSWSSRSLLRLLARSRVFRPVFTARLCQYQGSGWLGAPDRSCLAPTPSLDATTGRHGLPVGGPTRSRPDNRARTGESSSRRTLGSAPT